MKLISALTLIASVAVPAGALAQTAGGEQHGPQFTIGAGLVSAPTYHGDDDFQTSLLPNVSVRYGDWLTASLRGIEYVALAKDRWRLGTVVSYDFGREERPDDSPFAIAGDPTNDLVGLGDVDGTLGMGGFVEYQANSFVASFKLEKGVDGGHDGITGEASAGYRGRVKGFGRPGFYSVGPVLSFADSAYNSTYFDISAEQSAASGISPFDAGGGVNSIGLQASLVMPLEKQLSLVAFFEYEQLTGDVERSSLVAERGSKDQLMTGVFLNYSF